VKITITTQLDEYGSPDHFCIDMDGCLVMSIGRGEPEDMTLNRDLSDVLVVPDMLRAAYEAGLRGERLEFEEITKSEEE
jgi:hypothetical protein